MTERKKLSLAPEQQQLREMRAEALARLTSSGSNIGKSAKVHRPSNPATKSNAGASKPAASATGAAKVAAGVKVDGAVRPGRMGTGTVADGPSKMLGELPSGGGVRPSDNVRPTTQARTDGVRVVKNALTPGTVNSADGIRLNKRMAELGLCSRREGDDWIEKGWVTVNGEVAVMGQLVRVQDRIEIAPAARGQQRQQVTILLHKPVGYVSGQAEDGHEPAVTLINPRTHWSGDGSRTRFNFDQLKGLAPAGRLDIDSVGLLVLTQDGRVARQLIGEDSDIEKEYLVRVTYATVQGDVDTNVQAVFPPERLALLRHGLSLDGEPLKPAHVDWQNPEQLRFILKQGKKRQIRRMCEQVGLKVVGLKRIRMGRVVLGNLPAGQWRYLGPHESF